ncbi:MAG: CRISPR-associated helicase Cas3', partial [Exilibacterium sp.]
MSKSVNIIRKYFHYWGKARPDSAAGSAYHLLPFHCLDVAAVGFRLLDGKSTLCGKLAAELRVSPETFQAVFAWCLSLHDLGKYARAFQNLVPDLSPDLVSALPDKSYVVKHDSLGFLIWSERIEEKLRDEGFLSFGCMSAEFNTFLDNISILIEVVTGHHGVPPDKRFEVVSPYFDPSDIDAVIQFFNDATDLFLADKKNALRSFSGQDIAGKLRRLSWRLAGVAVLADWLGSNQNIFKYVAQPCELSDYWVNIALPAADQALKLIDRTSRVSEPPFFDSIQALFPYIDSPTPLQEFAAQVDMGDGPQMFILEDVTGAGKTEAAMVLAHRFMSDGLANGLYVALPTMATANAMYERMGKVYRKLFPANIKPSLSLAHGASQLSDLFRQSVGLEAQSKDISYGEDEPSASAFCNAWLADSRKKALLADVGVGTLDQALLSVLPARHQSLRVLGLSDKILIVDEVHAYDSYMNKLLQALLEFHAKNGGSAILLSATIPGSMRKRLVNAYAKGLNSSAKCLMAADYPLITQVSKQNLYETHTETRESVKRSVSVNRLSSEEEVIQLIQRTIAQGQCVCWIRNTVKDAVRSFDELNKVEGIDKNWVGLFHSRFAMIDRQAIENKTLRAFGKASGFEQRKGKVLIATQVVEQSLDLDFDVLITDLAPVDLVIQRAGRLHRHTRDEQGNILCEVGAKDRRDKPVLYVLSPDPDINVDEAWLKNLLPGTQAVYPHLGQLWLTARQLFSGGRSAFQMPEDARLLIEGVYGEEADEGIPEALCETSLVAEGEQSSQRA